MKKNSENTGIDLFEDYENIPKKVQKILDKYAEKFGDDFGNMDYKDMADMHNEIYAVGYTFESGLDNQPFDLRPIGTKGKSEMNEFKNGGGIKLSEADMVFIENMELWVIGNNKVPKEKKLAIKYATLKSQKIDPTFNPKHLLGKSAFYAKGGSLDNENSDMVLNNNNQISHHTKELENAVNKNKNIPAWVVAKINRSATDISDATHYLEGTKYKKGGGVDKFTKEGNQLKMFSEYENRNVIVAYINDNSKIITPTSPYYLPNPIAKEVVKWSKKNDYQFMQDDKEYNNGGLINNFEYSIGGL